MATHSSILAKDNPMDRGDWRAIVHGVAKRWIRLKRIEHVQAHKIKISAINTFSML